MGYVKEEVVTDFGWEPIPERKWKHDMWRFWEDPMTFFRACICPCVVYADLREMLEPEQSYFNSIILYVVTFPMFKHFLLSGAQRAIIRGRFFISEDEKLGTSYII
eukprot:NODE_230_length_13723_cov_0.393570.p10 type:complete len:106 gc:universal NODE_230_length_13723_cov_0.393570:233-550(+)